MKDEDILNHRYLIDAEGTRVYINDPDDGGCIIRTNNRDMLFKWCEENCKGRYWIGMGFGKFELEEDIILFKFRWG